MRGRMGALHKQGDQHSIRELKVWTWRVNKNLGSLVCLCLLIAIYELDIVVSVLFLNIATQHTLPAR